MVKEEHHVCVLSIHIRIGEVCDVHVLKLEFGSPVMAVCPYAGIWWGTYEKAKLWISQAAPEQLQGTPVHLAGGMVAGAVASILINPLDIIKVCLACVCIYIAFSVFQHHTIHRDFYVCQ